MICDECKAERDRGVHAEWVAAYSMFHTGSASRITYSGFAPVETYLCTDCFEPRAKRDTRNWRLSLAGFLVGAVGLLVLSYQILVWRAFVPGNQLPGIAVWQIIVGLASGLIGLFLLKLVWEQITSPMKWRRDSPATKNSVHYPYALSKAKAAGRDTVWDLRMFEILQQSTAYRGSAL